MALQSCRSLLVLMLCVLSSSTLSFAGDESGAQSTARAKLDQLLACQQTEKDAALAEKRQAQAKIADIETFIGSLSDRPVHYAAHEKASRALTVARDALAKVEERIRLADLKLGMTLRALSYLPPTQGGPRQRSGLSDIPRQAQNLRADAENDSRYVDGLLGEEFGFVTDPKEIQQLELLVGRLQTLSPRPDVPITVRIVHNGFHGAAATATTIYFDKAYLDQHPSESELLFIAGHELAHVQLGHYGETLMGMEKDSESLESDLGREAYGTLGRRTKRILHKLRTAPWERQQEEAADILGAQQALQAGALPHGIYQAMTRMDDDEKKWAKPHRPDVQRYWDSLRDHAKPMERLKRLEKTLGEKFWERNETAFSTTCGHK